MFLRKLPHTSSIRRISAHFGLVGIGIMTCSFLFSALNYHGRMGQRYQIWNHFVSELGEVGISQYAGLFNAALITGGLCITVFMLGTAYEFQNWFSLVQGASGLITGISAVLVGFYPMNNLQAHIRVAMLFFNMGLFTMTSFSLYVAFTNQHNFPKWFAIPGGFAALCFAVFLNIPSSSGNPEPALSIQEHLFMDRPPVWFLAIMEWVVVVAVLLWIFTVSLYDLLAHKQRLN